MTTLDGFHLPGISDEDIQEWQQFTAAEITVRVPLLTPDGLRRAISRLRTAQQRLHAYPIGRIVAAIDAVAGRLRDPDDSMRRTAEATLPALTGYSAPMIRLILDRMAGDWQAPALERMLDAELDGGDVLDRIVTLRGRRTLAVPYPVVLHVFAGNVPGVAVTSLVRALLVRSASLGKTAAGEPLLAALFARALAQADETLTETLAVCYWPGGDEQREQVVFGAADAIVAYGGAAALADIRRRAPAHTPVLDHGPRLSVGFVARDAVSDEAQCRSLATDVAAAIATFDQQGCVSPHAVFVEEGALDAATLADLLARALEVIQHDLPRGALTSAEATAIRKLRTRAEFGAFAGSAATLVSQPDAPFTVILHAAAGFEPSCLQRTVHVYPVRQIDDALHALAPYHTLLQSAALAGGDDTLRRRIAHSGFTRITSFARMAWPDPAGHHDGRGPLRELLRMVSVETS